MKRIFTFLVAVLLTATLWAQIPEKMSYQAVIRDASDNLVTSQTVGMQISILQGSASGTEVYVETQTPTSNANGLVSLEIGTGTVVSGDFTTIDWANGPYFIKTETAVEAPLTTYTITGTSQLLSVPYALHAKTAESVDNITVDYADVTNTPDLSNFDQNATDDFNGDYNNLTNTPDLSGFLTIELDGDATNEIQDLQLVGNILTITNNGTATDIDLSAYLDNTDTQLSDAEIATMGYIKNADDADADATNEIQDLQLVGNILTITNNGTATDIDLSAYLDNTDTQLSDAEIATMGYIKNADDADADATNEIELPTTANPGDMNYWNGTAWVTVAATENEGATLQMIGGVPTWTGGTPPTPNVTNPTTGEIWMDRNLGASQVATSSTDADAYGDLYQWGRGTDGHEKRTSGTTATLSSSDSPGHGDFITNGSPYDWRSTQNDNLWQGVSGTNNPCPSGYRLPTEAEWEAERVSWGSNNAAGAFASPLKLPVAGRRIFSNGLLDGVGSHGYYWSSAVGGTNSQGLYFSSGFAGVFGYYRAYGYSVRCLKD